ncbi:CDP-L-myo-inositol myo-inositolphosphotransferase [Kribbella sp. VKM Ac-2527]|uniref:Bifunctional IPC transferase and DIPP synthase n=1 Tax=Kribbella caucasensis TaxID=2512215 RepID=A0A4R6JJD1_9ACTN|nr:NTP transferase domain-containing protein [Kribbella sp. VKM Ac-2527]TDO36310.1 CDP-L-myo-inositol myo-inositolphosphotransferase [Kribbella sp. VKM Ac-2527]
MLDETVTVRVALLLAAGRGLRMRSANPKALRRVGGISLLERCTKVLQQAGVERIVVVVGYRCEDVIAAVKARNLKVEVVTNPDWQQGTASSVLAGLREVGDQRCLVVMGDHVFEADDVRRLTETTAGNVAAVDRDLDRQVVGLSGIRPNRVLLCDDGHVASLGPDLIQYDAVDAGLTVVEPSDVLSVATRPPETWLELRQQLLANGRPMQTREVHGLWADVDTPEAVRALERFMWRRYGPKPTDGVIARVVNRRISGPLTRVLLHTGLTPDLATALAFAVTLLAAGLVATGNTWLMIAGGLGVVLGSALDGVDGELARVSGTASRRGATLDTLLDRYADLAVVLALILATGPTPSAWPWGFAAATGCLLVSYVHAVGRDTDVRLLFRREFRLLIFAIAAILTVPLWGLIAVAVAANLDVIRGVILLLRAMRE